MPTSTHSLTAVVVSGGKQYRVTPGDRLLVDRVQAEPGSEIALSRVLLVNEDGQVKVTPDELQGVQVTAKVLQHERGPKIDVLRFKPKKRVRVHKGARAGLTALEILSVGGAGASDKTASGQAAEGDGAGSKRKTTSRSRKTQAAEGDGKED